MCYDLMILQAACAQGTCRRTTWKLCEMLLGQWQSL